MAPDVTGTTRCPAARSVATSPQNLAIAVLSIAPVCDVIDDVPILATMITWRLARRSRRRQGCAAPSSDAPYSAPAPAPEREVSVVLVLEDRKSTRLTSSH